MTEFCSVIAMVSRAMLSSRQTIATSTHTFITLDRLCAVTHFYLFNEFHWGSKLLTILAVGEDADLLRTRAAVLQKTGANVLCSSGASALKFIAEWEFDLVVLGHSVRPQDAKQITEAVHQQGSKTLVLLLVSDETQEQTYEGIALDGRSFVDPACLIRSASQLLGRQQSPHLPGKELKMPSGFSMAKKKPASVPADISARRAQMTRFENRKAG